MVGTTRESINKTLALFRRQGVLGKQSSRLVIKDATGSRSACIRAEL